MEENQAKLYEHQRKLVVQKRDIARHTSQADTLEERVSLLEQSIMNGKKSLAELEEREGETSMQVLVVYETSESEP